MSRCITIFGHQWNKWELNYGAPRKEIDGCLYKQKVQVRTCTHCNFTETLWIESYKLLEPKSEKDE